MKQNILAIAVIVSITGCSKINPGVQPNSIINVQVLSYTNNAPVGGATVVTSKCVEPDYLVGCTRWQDNTFNTASDGSFTMDKGYESKMYVYKPGYWTCSLWNSQSNTGDIQFLNGTAGLDKIIIKLFEQVRINVHVKNTSAIADSIFLYFIAEGVHPNKPAALTVPLRKGIDTTFAYTAFGQLNNRMKVMSSDSYYSIFGTNTELYSKDVFLAAGSNTLIDINF